MVTPGVGKSSISRALANDLHLNYAIFNAEIDKKQDLEHIIKQAENVDKFIIIIEEVQCMNKNRQNILLRYLENGNLIMFACTTENPYFVVNPSLRSRSNVIKLEQISPVEMLIGLQKLIVNKKLSLTINDVALKLVCQLASGDLRIAINILELCLNLYPKEEITSEIINNIFSSNNLVNFSNGNEHNDLKSALQKSIRGSDVDASLYYFTRLLTSGNYESLLRRMLIIAYEDIGLANPSIIMHVKTAIDSFRQIGLSEGRIPLGLAIVEMCLSEKSNSAYLATVKAHDDVLNGKIYPIPFHLRNINYYSMGKL